MSFYIKYELSEKPDNFSYHCHNHIEFLFCIRASAEFCVESFKYKMRPFDLFAVAERKYHFLNVLNSSPYERCVVSFERGDFAIPDNILDSLLEAKVINIADEKIIGLLYKIIEYRKKGSPVYDKLCKNVFEEMLVLLSEYVKNANLRPDVSFDPYAEKIISVVERRLTENLTLDDIANEVGLSKFYLCRYFKAHMNISLMRYINDKRILLAQNLMRKGTPCEKAAALSGFNEYSAFFRCYKKKFAREPKKDYIKK